MTQARPRILHVEDDPSLQNLVRIALEQIGGYEVQSATTGEQALELAWLRPPALVLLDLDLPGINGVDTLRSLRTIPGLADVPVVFLTAAVDRAAETQLRQLGAREVMRKPFRPRALVDTIRRVLA